jgi:hypothetical protein
VIWRCGEQNGQRIMARIYIVVVLAYLRNESRRTPKPPKHSFTSRSNIHDPAAPLLLQSTDRTSHQSIKVKHSVHSHTRVHLLGLNAGSSIVLNPPASSLTNPPHLAPHLGSLYNFPTRPQAPSLLRSCLYPPLAAYLNPIL